MSEFAAAAKRIIREAIDEIRELSGDVADVLSGGNPHDTLTYRGTLLHRLLEAACVLQRHVLTEHPADDAEPVTRDWLESVQRKVVRYEGKTLTHDMSIGYHHGANCHTVSLRSPIGQCDIVDVLVRADVRRLLAALGVSK